MTTISYIICDHVGCTTSIRSVGGTSPVYSTDFPGWRVKTLRNGTIRHRCPEHRHDWSLRDPKVAGS